MSSMLSSKTLPRANKPMSNYISDAAAIKEFYTAVSLVNNQDVQHRIHQAMDKIISAWTKRYEDMINAMNELEYSYATLQHESQAESTMYHKCMRDLQFYKAKCDLISYTGPNHHYNKNNNSSSLSFDRRSYLSMDSCGRSTIATCVSNTSKTIYSRSTNGQKSSYLGHASLDSFYYPATASSSIASSRGPSSTHVPDDDDSILLSDGISIEQKENEDTFDMASVFEHCYPTHIPSPKPPPADDVPLPPPPLSSNTLPSSLSSPSLPSSNSSIILPKEILEEASSSSPATKKVETTEPLALVGVPSQPIKKIQGQDIHAPPPPPSSHVPCRFSVTGELKFACGDGFWHTIAKGKSNKEDVDTLIKNYLKRGGQPNVANNSGTIKSVKEGYGLIHALIVVRNTHALRRILEAGANPNALPLVVSNDKNQDSISPLVLAASLGYMNGVRLLVERARVNVLTSYGPKQKNALLAAIQVDALDVVIYLLRINRKLLDQVDEDGATPLHYASMAGKTRMLTFLVKECGQICDAVDYKGDTPLHYALRYHRSRAAAKLVDELGADPNVIKKIATPLALAKSGGLNPIMAMVRSINNNLK